MNMIRFGAYEGERLVAQTEWAPEHDRNTAVNLLEAFRKQHSGLAYRIERTGDSKVPNLRKLTRATIKDGFDIYYSRWFDESELTEQINAIRQKWPKADITTETRNG